MPLILILLGIIGLWIASLIDKRDSKKKAELYYKHFPERKNTVYEDSPATIAHMEALKAEQKAKDRLKRCDPDRKDNKTW